MCSPPSSGAPNEVSRAPSANICRPPLGLIESLFPQQCRPLATARRARNEPRPANVSMGNRRRWRRGGAKTGDGGSDLSGAQKGTADGPRATSLDARAEFNVSSWLHSLAWLGSAWLVSSRLVWRPLSKMPARLRVTVKTKRRRRQFLRPAPILMQK